MLVYFSLNLQGLGLLRTPDCTPDHFQTVDLSSSVSKLLNIFFGKFIIVNHALLVVHFMTVLHRVSYMSTKHFLNH